MISLRKKRMKARMKLFFLVISPATVICFFCPFIAHAVCPVCTVAVGAGVGLSRWLGIDDTISGLWIGGLLISLTMWTQNWLSKKNVNFKHKNIVVFLAYFLLIVAPFYFSGIIGIPFNNLWGVDKLLLGIVLGAASFFLGGMWYYRLKEKNKEHAYFSFQKVVMPITPLVILSTVFYFITR